MSEQLGSDPLDALRAADPVRDDHLPSASLARVRARVSEDIMNATTTTARTGRPVRLLGAGAVAVAVAAFAFVVVLGQVAAPGTGTDPGQGVASCVEQYGPATLAGRDFAFDGRVTSIDGERVTFEVGRAYKGVSEGTITLDAPGMTGVAITSAGGPTFAVGQRYLVAGDATFAWGCGFSQSYDAGVAAEWSSTFGG